jgi:hypothetical protein
MQIHSPKDSLNRNFTVTYLQSQAPFHKKDLHIANSFCIVVQKFTCPEYLYICERTRCIQFQYLLINLILELCDAKLTHTPKICFCVYGLIDFSGF